jgi:hypothetical protein
MRLIDFAVDYESLLARLDQCDESEEQAILDEINTIADGFDSKLEACGWIYKSRNAEAEAFELEAERMTKKAARLRKQGEAFKKYIEYCLQGKNLKTKTFTFTHRKSESVEIIDEAQIPPQYLREKFIVEPDKKLIKTDLKIGAVIPGCTIKETLNFSIK